MKPIQIVSYNEDFVTGKVERDVDTGYLIAPDVAVVTCISTLYFIRVKPSTEGAGLYDDAGPLCDIIVPSLRDVDVSAMPREALTFAMWAAAKPLAAAV